jgi:hypothetical protein
LVIQPLASSPAFATSACKDSLAWYSTCSDPPVGYNATFYDDGTFSVT